jgi:hypothetical protein
MVARRATLCAKTVEIRGRRPIESGTDTDLQPNSLLLQALAAQISYCPGLLPRVLRALNVVA